MSTFITAAQRRERAEAAAAAQAEQERLAAEEAGEEYVEPKEPTVFWPDTMEGPYEFRVPTGTQIALYGARLRESGGMTAVLRLLIHLMEPEQYLDLVAAVERSDIELIDLIAGDPADEQKGGLIGLLVEAASGHPTQPLSASSETPKRTGSRSTGRARSGASTRSTSRSTDS